MRLDRNFLQKEGLQESWIIARSIDLCLPDSLNCRSNAVF
jgi:hypothetical protein